MTLRMEGLPNLGREVRALPGGGGGGGDDESVMLTMCILLYADDATCMAESAQVLHRPPDAVSDYCDGRNLRIKAVKSKLVSFQEETLRHPKYKI